MLFNGIQRAACYGASTERPQRRHRIQGIARDAYREPHTPPHLNNAPREFYSPVVPHCRLFQSSGPCLLDGACIGLRLHTQLYLLARPATWVQWTDPRCTLHGKYYAKGTHCPSPRRLFRPRRTVGDALCRSGRPRAQSSDETIELSIWSNSFRFEHRRNYSVLKRSMPRSSAVETVGPSCNCRVHSTCPNMSRRH